MLFLAGISLKILIGYLSKLIARYAIRYYSLKSTNRHNMGYTPV